MLKVSVYRYNPDQDAAPFMQEFQVDTGGKDLMVLDVLALIKEQDEGFSYRRSCREGVCGSDGMNINGKNGLACITPLSAVVKGNKLVVRPLPGLPVIRDLVVDMSIFYKQYEKVKPFLQNDTPARRSVRVHPVRLLLDLLPVLLVEPGQVPGSSCSAASLSLPGRQPRHQDYRASGFAG
jgi:succinate dehydrogenase/fumarate reductase iron-sulfur protein